MKIKQVLFIHVCFPESPVSLILLTVSSVHTITSFLLNRIKEKPWTFISQEEIKSGDLNWIHPGEEDKGFSRDVTRWCQTEIFSKLVLFLKYWQCFMANEVIEKSSCFMGCNRQRYQLFFCLYSWYKPRCTDRTNTKGDICVEEF